MNVDLVLPCITPPDITPRGLSSLLTFLSPLARPEGITESVPDLALPLVFLVLTGLDPLDLLPDCLEDLSDISDDGLLLLLVRFDLSMSLGLAPVSLPVSLEVLSLTTCSAVSVETLLVEAASTVEVDVSPDALRDDDPLREPSSDSLRELVLLLDPLLEPEP